MKRKARPDALTGDMFAVPRPAAQIPGSMDYRQPVSLLVGDMLKDAHAAGLDRFEVAARAQSPDWTRRVEGHAGRLHGREP